MTALDSGDTVVWIYLYSSLAKPCQQSVIIKTPKRRMRLSRRTKIRFHSQMNLYRPALEPASAALGQLRRLHNFPHPQQRPIKRSSSFLAARRHGELYMIDRA